MKFWDQMMRFHELSHGSHPNGAEGLAGVHFLRSIFEPNWKEELSARHPFRHRIGHASTGNYEWLVQFARKIRTAQALRGFPLIERRLGDPGEFPGAAAEMEVALMLSLGGFVVEFLSQGDRPSPDIQAERDGVSIGVEVGSVNPPAEHARLDEAMNRILMRGFVARVVTGGVISRPPSDSDLELIGRRVESAVTAAVDEGRAETVNLPGLATIYVAPPDLASRLPEDCRGQFRTVPLYERSPEERIARALRQKIPQYAGFHGAVVLFLYDNALGADATTRLFEDPGDDVGAVLATIPHLGGFALVESCRFRERPQKPSEESRGSRMRLTVPVGVNEWADVLFWENKLSAHPLPNSLVDAIRHYGENLAMLRSLDAPG